VIREDRVARLKAAGRGTAWTIATPKPSNGFGQSAAIERPAKFSRRTPTSFLIIEISSVFGCGDYHQTKARL